LQQVADLEAKKRAGSLSPEERINLGACLIRLGRLDPAIGVLEEALRVVPADADCRFLILANLASAYQERADLLPRAIATQTMALKAWPRLWAGWGSEEWNWYRRAETYALKLMQLRQNEWRNAAGRPVTYQTVDALFPGVRFVGPGGHYEAGTIDFDMWNQLPRDADALVRQLVLWQPSDDRLFWLYGELLNAAGDVEFAFQVLKELVDARRQGGRELYEHRRVLRAAQEPFKTLLGSANEPGKLRKLTVQEALLWSVAPRGQLTAPGIGAVAQEMGWAAAHTRAGQLDGEVPISSPAAPESSASPPAPSGWVPDWRGMGVSFVAGVVVALLGALQWQQWRRRRQPAADSRPEAVGPRRQPVADSR
jgi:tetratricopeptide (TPR) repeat protein